MAQVKSMAISVDAPVGGSLYAPHHLGAALDYNQCWEARTALPLTVTRTLPSMVGGSSLTGPTADLTVTTPATGSVYLTKTLNTQRLRVAGQTVSPRTVMLVSSGFGNASSFLQIPGMAASFANGQVYGFGTATISLAVDSAAMNVRVFSLNTTTSQLEGSIGAIPFGPITLTANTTTDIYVGSNLTAPVGSDEKIVACRIWPRVLNATEIASVVSYAQTAYGLA